MQDEQIMNLVAKGDLSKMRILFDRYQVYLYNFFLKKGHDAMTSEDLTQGVFERVIKYRESYQSSQSFKPWIFRIARNIAADNYRNAKLPMSDVPMSGLKVATSNVLDDIEKMETNQRLNQAIRLLKEDEQELIHFSKFQGMKYGEIATLTQLSESAIKVKMHRTMKKLKANYQKLDSL